jgi:hypothetical protein
MQTLLSFGCQGFKYWLQNNPKQINDVSLQVVFTTSGTPSTPLPIIPVGKALHGKRQLTLTERVSQYNGEYSVYRGDLDGERVVTKITEDVALGEVLRHEASIYDRISDLQGFVVPTFFGLFSAGGCYFLVTADCGVSLGSFSSLSNAERYVYFCFIITFN